MKSGNSLTPLYSIPSLLRSTPIAIFVIAALYILLVKISFLVTIDPGTVSPVFIASGFAFASVLILGHKALIGVWIGSLYSNTFIHVNILNLNKEHFLTYIPIGIFISIGTTIAAITGTSIVLRLCKKEDPLNNGRSVLILLILGSISYSTITSLTGVISLIVEGSVPIEQFWYTYKTWWLGDAIGIILITPLILSWFLKDSFKRNNFNFFELTFYGLLSIVVYLLVFFQYNDLKYLIFPLLFWSAYRFPIQITTLIILIISLFAIITTTQGIGPFNEGHMNDSILFLDLFLSTISICSLFLSGIIAERKKAEDSIIASENNLRKNQILLESTLESPKNFSIYSIGRNYEYLSFNHQHSRNMKILFGANIALGMKLQDCNIKKEDLDEAVEVLNKAFLGENTTTVKHFDSNNSHWEFKTSPIASKNDGIIGATVISTDITKKIKDEEALKRSEEKYRNIFETVQDVIFQTDINGIFIELSPSIKDFCGYTAEELIGKPTYFLQPDDEKSDEVIKLVNEHSVLYYYERVIKKKSGSLKHISLSAKMIFDNEGNKHHINAIARDITQRKENENEIAYQNQKLQIQNKELEQFAYITSHDLQEPLVTLKYFSELIKTEFQKEINENINQYLNFILESSDRMQKLVKGLLDYSRIGNQIELEEINCNEIVNDAISSLSEIIEETNCKITIEDLPKLKGYSIELTELFQHLISNAIKFRKKEAPPIIKINAKLIDENWQFTVEDNGIGIDERDKEKAFVIFKRLNNREDYPGTGIGLAICKKIIALHGGNIWIKSTLRAGTSIHFTIPIKK